MTGGAAQRVYPLHQRDGAGHGERLLRPPAVLVGGEQVAFDPVGKKLQRALAHIAGCHTLALLLQALGNPLRQHLALHRVELQGDTKTVQRHKPRARAGGLVQARQDHQGECGVVALRTGGQLLQGDAAVLAGFAGRDTHFDDLFVGKQAQ